jgi:excinuclease ABC subunit C
MDKAAEALDFERAAVLRDRLSALAAVQARQDINPRDIEEADVFAIHHDGGFFCIEVFFFRAGQNWGNRAYFPRADRTLTSGEVLGAFLAQFYDDKPCPRLILLSDEMEDRELLAQALTIKTDRKIEVMVPRRGSKRDVIEHALANAREALGRKLAEAASQQRLLSALAASFGLAQHPRRIEVYDNSHIQGSNAVGAMIVAGPEGLRKNQYRKFNIKSADVTPGDDFGMMREVLTRRFKRLLSEKPRDGGSPPLQAGEGTGCEEGKIPPGGMAPPEDAAAPEDKDTAEQAWPDLVLIDGGAGQLHATRETLAALGIHDVTLVGIAKGPDRDAGRETFYMAGREPFRLPLRDPVLYFVQRLRDEAHRFAIGAHRQRRSRDIREAGLQEISGIGPTRKRALLRHFGTLKAIERASIADLTQVPGINAETARRIYDFFHESSG